MAVTLIGRRLQDLKAMRRALALEQCKVAASLITKFKVVAHDKGGDAQSVDENVANIRLSAQFA